MIDSMFLGIFAALSGGIVALVANFAFATSRDIDPDVTKSLAKMSMYLLTTFLICLGSASEVVLGGIAVTAYTLLGMFAFVIAEECINSRLVSGLVDS